MYMRERPGWLPMFTADNYLTEKQCRILIDQTKTVDAVPAVRIMADGTQTVDTQFRHCENFIFPMGHPAYALMAQPLFEKLAQWKKDFDFELYPARGDMLPEVFINRYDGDGDVKGHLTWHHDSGEQRGMAQRKISVSVLLNDPSEFEGGELDFFDGRERQPLAQCKAGDGVAFPSFAFHRVRPVTRGVRYSVVAWLRGPRFR